MSFVKKWKIQKFIDTKKIELLATFKVNVTERFTWLKEELNHRRKHHERYDDYDGVASHKITSGFFNAPYGDEK